MQISWTASWDSWDFSPPSLNVPQLVGTTNAQCEGGYNTVFDLIMYQYSFFKTGRLLIKKEACISLFL